MLLISGGSDPVSLLLRKFLLSQNGEHSHVKTNDEGKCAYFTFYNFLSKARELKNNIGTAMTYTELTQRTVDDTLRTAHFKLPTQGKHAPKNI
jgi:hypothetical protein